MTTQLRVIRSPSGLWIPQRSTDGGATWCSLNFRAYQQRGWALRHCASYTDGKPGQWRESGDITTWEPADEAEPDQAGLGAADQAALEHWRGDHKTLIEQETSEWTPEELARLEFAKWLYEHGKLHDHRLPHEYGLEQTALWEGGEA